jgi:hypothetical protein
MAVRRKEPVQDAAALRRTMLWSAAAFVGVGVAGFAFAPGLTLVWAIVLLFGIAAIPQAFRRNP